MVARRRREGHAPPTGQPQANASTQATSAARRRRAERTLSRAVGAMGVLLLPAGEQDLGLLNLTFKLNNFQDHGPNYP